MVKEYYQKFEHSPSFDTLNQVAKSEIAQELLLKITLDTISDIKNNFRDGVLDLAIDLENFNFRQESCKCLQCVVGPGSRHLWLPTSLSPASIAVGALTNRLG